MIEEITISDEDLIKSLQKKSDKTYRKITKQMWKDIVYKDGKLDEEQVLKELYDYSFLIRQASLVYCEVAGLSKTNYNAETIIQELNDRYLNKKDTQDDVESIIKYSKTKQELIDELLIYFEIK